MAKADDPVELAEESERLSAHGDPRKVVAAAVRALEARRRVGGWSPTAPLLRASLHLTARGHHDAGARILYELRKLPPGELQDGFTSEDELLTWLVTRDLASLSPDFPDDLRREIASATVEPRPGCPEDLITFMVQDRPEEAVDALREIEEKASTLYQMYGDVLWVPDLARQPELARKPAPERDRDPSLRHALSRLGLWVLILAVIALAREGCSTEPPPPVPEAPPPRVEEAPTDPAPTDLAAAVARDATHDLDAFCAFAPDSAWDCTLGYAIVEAYSEARCLEARGAMVELSRLIEFDRAGYVPPSTLEILRSLGSHTDCGDPGADRYGRPPT
jgi:hypothetical protein